MLTGEKRNDTESLSGDLTLPGTRVFIVLKRKEIITSRSWLFYIKNVVIQLSIIADNLYNIFSTLGRLNIQDLQRRFSYLITKPVRVL